MADRILEILHFYNLSQSEFAEIIKIQRSTLSHIFSGRNKPSLDILEKILKQYPDIQTDWLLFGKSTMFIKDDSSSLPLFQDLEISKTPEKYNHSKNDYLDKITDQNILSDSQRVVDKVVFFYTNGEFEIFTQKKG